VLATSLFGDVPVALRENGPGNLEPYDRPGKTSLFRTYAYFLQPSVQNATDFWSSVVDPVWLANSPDPDAAAMRDAQQHASAPWRLLYRVTYSERFLPPISTGSTAVPQITPIMAVPVLDSATDFAFEALTAGGTRPAKNPANDIEANVVLVSPTQSGGERRHDRHLGPVHRAARPAQQRHPLGLLQDPAHGRQLGRQQQRQAPHPADHLGHRQQRGRHVTQHPARLHPGRPGSGPRFRIRHL